MDDYVDLPYSSTLEVTTHFTVEAWIRPDDVSNYRQIFSRFGNAGSRSFQLGLAPGGMLRADISSDGTTYEFLVSFSGMLSAGTWAHVAVSFEPGLLKLFVDGQLAAARHFDSLLSVNGGRFASSSIGRDPAGIQYYAGLVDELALYGRALADAEIQAIYTVGRAGKCPTLPYCMPPPDGLLSWWPGAGSATDTIGGSEGALFNGASFTSGRIGQAFNFDGVNDYVALPDVTKLRSAGTVEFWFKLDSWNWNNAPSGLYLWSAAAGPPNSSAGDYLSIGTHPGYAATGELMFGFYSADWQWAMSGVVPVPGVWYHVAAIWDADFVGIYVNGTLRNLRPASFSPPPTTQGLLGCSSWPNTFIAGRIDEVSIYNRVLTPSEIQSQYFASSLGKCIPPPCLKIISTRRTGGNATLTWLSEPGATYRVQYKADLRAANWTNLAGDVNATDATASKVDNTLGGAAQRFYQVLKLP